MACKHVEEIPGYWVHRGFWLLYFPTPINRRGACRMRGLWTNATVGGALFFFVVIDSSLQELDASRLIQKLSLMYKPYAYI